MRAGSARSLHDRNHCDGMARKKTIARSRSKNYYTKHMAKAMDLERNTMCTLNKNNKTNQNFSNFVFVNLLSGCKCERCVLCGVCVANAFVIHLQQKLYIHSFHRLFHNHFDIAACARGAFHSHRGRAIYPARETNSTAQHLRCQKLQP